ncbi:YkgJ family cysteine cluster protein, partial [Thermodesulfobacteriota bacterium]
VVMRSDNSFPDVLLRMTEDAEKTCPFLTDRGCSVYSDRPHTCRLFPLEQGVLCDALKGETPAIVHFFRAPRFCLGRHREKTWTPETWRQDQEADFYSLVTALWAEMRWLFREDAWGEGGFGSPKAKMAFMASYNVDRFREFVLQSSFLGRFRVEPTLLQKLETDDVELMFFGWDWVRWYLWRTPSQRFGLA